MGWRFWKAKNVWDEGKAVWENKWLKIQLQEAREEIEEIKKSRNRVVKRISMIEDRVSDIARIAFASNYTRKDIINMSNEEFKECEAEIDKDTRDGRTFLPE